MDFNASQSKCNPSELRFSSINFSNPEMQSFLTKNQSFMSIYSVKPCRSLLFFTFSTSLTFYHQLSIFNQELSNSMLPSKNRNSKRSKVEISVKRLALSFLLHTSANSILGLSFRCWNLVIRCFSPVYKFWERQNWRCHCIRGDRRIRFDAATDFLILDRHD